MLCRYQQGAIGRLQSLAGHRRPSEVPDSQGGPGDRGSAVAASAVGAGTMGSGVRDATGAVL
jgi:hypothetical protein